MLFQKNEGNSLWNILYGQFRFLLERITIVREGTEERTKSARFVALCDIRLRYVRKRTARKNKYANEIHDSWPLSCKFLISILRYFWFFAEEHGTSSTFDDKYRMYQFLQFHILESLNFEFFAIKQFYSWKLLTSFQIRKFANLTVCSLKDSQCSSWKG